MSKNWTESYVFHGLDWIMKLAYINILWVFFTLVGLVILGFMPASVAMHTVIRKLIMKKDISITRLFFHTYKKEFLKANLIGLLIVAVGFLLYADLLFVQTMEGSLRTILFIALSTITILYGMIVLTIIPVYVQYELKFFQYFKTSIIISLVNFHLVLLMIAGITLSYFIFSLLPSLMVFFLGSGIAAINMWCLLIGHDRVKNKQETLKAV